MDNMAQNHKHHELEIKRLNQYLKKTEQQREVLTKEKTEANIQVQELKHKITKMEEKLRDTMNSSMDHSKVFLLSN